MPLHTQRKHQEQARERARTKEAGKGNLPVTNEAIDFIIWVVLSIHDVVDKISHGLAEDMGWTNVWRTTVERQRKDAVSASQYSVRLVTGRTHQDTDPPHITYAHAHREPRMYLLAVLVSPLPSACTS